MNQIDLIIKQAFKKDSAALNLVIQDIKPCTFITFKSYTDISSIQFKKFKFNKNIVYFIFPQAKGWVNLMIFNLHLISKKLDLINKHQSSYFFNNTNTLISHHIRIYKNKEKLRERLGIQKHADLNLIQGIIFGFPLKSIKLFDKEIKTRVLLPGRKFYSTKLSRSLVFVGYPGTTKQSKALIKKWEKEIKKFKQ